MRAAIRGKQAAALAAALLLVVVLAVQVQGTSESGLYLDGPPSVAWRWEATGLLPQGRAFHTATLLADGRVLVVGGFGLSQTTAALFDPASNTWSETGPLTTPRYGHTATLLADGRVLVAGGVVDLYSVHSSVELFDPAGGAWTAAADMPTARAFHAAALLPDGKVLVMGGALGQISTSGMAAVELYDPATDTWSYAEPMNKARAYHSVTVLADGRVLVVGGYAPGNVAELYDPTTGQWRYTGGRGVALPERHAAVRLDDGRVYVVGLREYGAAVYDPAAETWMAQDSPAMGEGFAAALLGDGRVMVSGGFYEYGFPPWPTYVDTVVLVDATTGLWEYGEWMHAGRAGHTLTRLADGSILATGGQDAAASAEVFRAHELTEQLFVPLALRGSEE